MENSKIPETIKIGGRIFKIKEVDGITDSGNSNSEIEHTILLNKRLCQTEKEVTLLHEILHAINSEIPEREIEYLSQALYQVLKENNLFR